MAATAQTPATDAQHAAFIDSWRHFSRAMQRAKARSCGDGELSLPQALLLNPLLESSALPVGALAARAEVAKPTATRMLDGLVRDGYAQRQQCDEDRRAVLVSLTPRGEQALHARWDRFRRRLERASAELDPAEREHATQLLSRLADLMDEI